MTYENSKAFRNTQGMGKIRQITRTVKGKTYTYYQVRYTEGYDPGTGKQIQRSITGKTPNEVAQKMRTVICAMESGTYVPPNKLTLGQWLDTWAEEYIGNVKDSTSAAYKASIRTHIKPKLGAVRLDALTTHMIQTFYNGLLESAEDRRAVSAKTVKNIHGILHKALRQAVANGYMRMNPTEHCILPRIEKRDIQPLDENEIKLFLPDHFHPALHHLRVHLPDRVHLHRYPVRRSDLQQEGHPDRVLHRRCLHRPAGLLG